jgi:hypothetical protein
VGMLIEKEKVMKGNGGGSVESFVRNERGIEVEGKTINK